MGRFKLFRRFVVPTVVAGAALNLPPKEQLPEPLLYPRVVSEGFGRLLRCCGVGLTILWDYKYNLYGIRDQESWDVVHQRSAEKLVDLAMLNGGMYVKSGQGFSQMNHLLPKQYCRTMKRLEDAITYRPIHEVRAVIEADLGKKVEEVFDDFDDSPIAAASLAQVHTARLKDEKRTKVAVKVQYIDIQQRFSGDIGTIMALLKVTGMLFPGYDFGVLVQKTQSVLEGELRFKDEAENSDRCGASLKTKLGGRVTTPTMVWPLTTDRVMVSEFVDGCKVTDVKSIKKMGFNPKDVAEAFCEIFAVQLFETGDLHCDPHGGNCLVRRHPDNPKKPQLVLLDHGLYTQVPPDIRRTLAEIWTFMVQHDTPNLAKSCLKLDIHEPEIFATMLLQHPYDFFSPFKKQATGNDVDLLRKGADEMMPKITAILEALPMELSLCMRNINIVRSVNKDMGNPVSRTAVMLRHSLKVSHSDDFFSRNKALWRLWFDETLNDLLMRYAKWKNPKLLEEMDEIFGMG